MLRPTYNLNTMQRFVSSYNILGSKCPSGSLPVSFSKLNSSNRLSQGGYGINLSLHFCVRQNPTRSKPTPSFCHGLQNPPDRTGRSWEPRWVCSSQHVQ